MDGSLCTDGLQQFLTVSGFFQYTRYTDPQSGNRISYSGTLLINVAAR